MQASCPASLAWWCARGSSLLSRCPCIPLPLLHPQAWHPVQPHHPLRPKLRAGRRAFPDQSILTTCFTQWATRPSRAATRAIPHCWLHKMHRSPEPGCSFQPRWLTAIDRLLLHVFVQHPSRPCHQIPPFNAWHVKRSCKRIDTDM